MHQVFPSVDSEIEIEKGKSTPNMVKLQFLDLLKYLRKVLLQDACIIMEKFSSCTIWQSRVFQSDRFFQFRNELREAIDEFEDPRTSGLHDVLPQAFSVILQELAQVKGKFHRI